MTKKRVPDRPNPATLKIEDTIPCIPLMPGITSEMPVLVVTKVVNDKHGHSIDFDLTFFGEVIGKARGWVDGDALSWDEEITNLDPDDEIPLLDTGEQIMSDAETFAFTHSDPAYDPWGRTFDTKGNVVKSAKEGK